MSYTMYTPLNVWLDPASVTDVVAYIQTYLSENTIYSETEIETIIHDYLIAHPELIGGVQSVNGKTGTVVLSASDINTENNVTIESVLASLSSQISSIAASVATNTSNITGLTGRMTTAETDLTNLKSNFDSITIAVDGVNKFNGTTIPDCFVNQATGLLQSNRAYQTSHFINVEGTNSVVISVESEGLQNYTLRYALYTSADETTYVRGAAVTGNDDSVNNRRYSVIDTTGTKYIRFSFTNVFFNNPNAKPMLAFGSASIAYETYKEKSYMIPNSLQFESSTIGTKPQSVYAATLASGDYLKIAGNNSIKKNKTIHIRANIDSNFTSVYCGIGEESYSLYWLIDDTNITFYTNGTSATVLAHGLTLDTYIDFQVIVGNTNVGKLILNTLGGTYTKDVQIVQGYKGEVFLKPNCAITNAQVTFACSDFRQPIWMFGDSYFTHTGDQRWPYWLLQWGYDRCLLNGFPGEQSADAIIQIQNYVANNGKPKFIVWCLGMNDPDTGAINASWMESVNSLIALCEQNDIIPIFSTIPNVPSYSNVYKNDWVRNSGYRYIDFAKAVGAEAAGSSWYAGCLSSDNTHPAEPGARLLCLQVLNDLPELMLGNI